MALEHPWTEPPAAAAAIAVAPGVHWLRMPLPFALDHINVWLLEDGAGWTVVDTGVGLPPTRERWTRVFDTLLAGRPITRVIVTHFHPDHMGNAAWLTERWPADLWCTQSEWLLAQYVRHVLAAADFQPRLAFFREHGVPEAALQPFRQRGNPYPKLVPALTGHYRAIFDGDVLRIGGRRWHVLTVRGHSPEHACLWSPDLEVLISGDQVLPKITTNISVWPDQPRANPLRLYLDSLERFRPLPAATLVLPSHNLPFRGLGERLDQLVAHHQARLAEAADALVEPRSAVDLVPVLFRRELDVHQLGFAVGEAIAHLNYLEAEGRATRLVGEDGVTRFVKS